MYELLKAFGAITVRRLGPEDLPASRFLLGLSLAFYLFVQMPVVLLAFGATEGAAIIMGLDVVILVAFVWTLLYVTGHRARYQQTLTAILGTSALLSLLSIPFTLWRRSMVDVPPGSTALPSALILMIVAWSFVVDGHILSRALSRPFGMGLLIAVAYFILENSLLFEFLPAEN